jgi:hypothetical protein
VPPPAARDAGYGRVVTISKSPPKRKWVRPSEATWVPATEAQIAAAEEFLIEILWRRGLVDSKLVRRLRRKHMIHRGALTIARKGLGVGTETTAWEKRGLMSVPTAWDWYLPEEPTVAGAAAIARYLERRWSSSRQP